MVEQKQIFNFSAGPCVLPREVLRRAQAECLDWHGTGISVMEMSHRSKSFAEIAETARSDLKKLMSIPDTHTIMFFQGGASQQFSAICQNLLGPTAEHQAANYLSTGTWSEGAVKEGAKYCEANEVSCNKGLSYSSVAPTEEWKIK
jgi:phosphoserine aminotransferase